MTALDVARDMIDRAHGAWWKVRGMVAAYLVTSAYSAGYRDGVLTGRRIRARRLRHGDPFEVGRRSGLREAMARPRPVLASSQPAAVADRYTGRHAATG